MASIHFTKNSDAVTVFYSFPELKIRGLGVYTPNSISDQMQVPKEWGSDLGHGISLY